MNKDTEILHGKTITKITQQAINCWRIDYEHRGFGFVKQGHVFLWAEIDGPLHLGHLWLSNEE
jgi:hypothetical protein